MALYQKYTVMDFSVWGSATPRCPNITLVKNSPDGKNHSVNPFWHATKKSSAFYLQLVMPEFRQNENTLPIALHLGGHMVTEENLLN